MSPRSGLGVFLVIGLSVVAAGQALDVAIRDTPFAAALSYGGELVVEVGDVSRSALYLNGWAGRVSLIGPPRVVEDEDETTLTYRTSDGRTARVALRPVEEGAIQVRFSVAGKARWERLGITLRVSEGEGFYGLLERPVQGILHESFPPRDAGFNLRGQEVWLYVLPTHALYSPFFVSSRGWGLYVESSWPGIYRFGRDGRGRSTPTQVTIEYEGPELVVRLFGGATPLEVVEKYGRTVGTTVLPPEWAFGPWRWRDEVWDLPTFYDGTPNTSPFNSMVVEDLLLMEALGIPCSVYVLDRPWAGGTMGYGDLRFDPERFPNAEAMLAWMKGRGARPILWLGPWVLDALRAEAVAQGYHVRKRIPYPPRAALLDFTSRDATAWWQGLLAPLLDLGIAGFKLDRGDEDVPDGLLFSGSYADGTSYREGHNAYPLWFARAAAGALPTPADSLLFVRAGWIGTSTYAIAWGGDPASNEWGLRNSVLALQRAAAINFPIWGSDTGGYTGRPSREVLARWLAFSAFCPLMEVGPTANLAPWSFPPDGVSARVDAQGYRFTPTYDEELVAIWILYARLHDDLRAYTYAQAVAAHERGTPIVRPLVFVHPDRPEYVDLWETYLYGPDLLVRPVWEPGATSVTVHIPPGEWRDLWTGEEWVGPRTVVVEAPLYAIPAYVRVGSDLDHLDLSARWAEAQKRARSRPDLGSLLPAHGW
ncbi:MAG TPA: glycoside hydrolase family 31 protein [Candidatus Bipolaricaulis sp.]|nr:glycoside hydrolase family 31 protein [Candidatus Bipolaricaulis sp.]